MESRTQEVKGKVTTSTCSNNDQTADQAESTRIKGIQNIIEENEYSNRLIVTET